MTSTDIREGYQYLVRTGVGHNQRNVAVEVIEVKVNAISRKGICPHNYRCRVLFDGSVMTVPCVNAFLRLAIARDTNCEPCGILTLVNDKGFIDNRRCVLPYKHRGKCLTSLYILQGLPTDREAEDWIASLTEDDSADYAPVVIPRANWPRFAL